MTDQSLHFISNNKANQTQIQDGIEQYIIKKTGIGLSKIDVYRELEKNNAIPINPATNKPYSRNSFEKEAFDLFKLKPNKEQDYWEYDTTSPYKSILDFTLKDLIQEKITRIDFFEASTRSESSYVTITISIENGFESFISQILPQLYPSLLEFHLTSGINYISFSSFDTTHANFIYAAIKSLKDKGILVGNTETEQS